jgi:hypothetical protein
VRGDPPAQTGLTGEVRYACPFASTRESAVPWIWTDELARLLLEAGLAREQEVAALLAHPYALAVLTEQEALEVARGLLPGEGEEAA